MSHQKVSSNLPTEFRAAAMTASNDYETWLRCNPAPDLHNPAPDLQELVARHDGYNKVTPEAWAEYDRAMAEWQERRRRRSEGFEDLPRSERSNPEALCIGGLPGVYWRPRKGGGRKIWRCEEHRDRWPDYVEDIPLKRATR